jgi:hypothetical protein
MEFCEMIDRIPLNRPARVYFAGKVNGSYEPDFWRRDWFGIVQDDNGSISQQPLGADYGNSSLYVGPILSARPHNDGHGNAVIHEAAVGEKPHNMEMAIYEQCITEILRADVVVARLSDGAYATMFEVGYATSAGISVIPFVENSDMWFASPGLAWGFEDFAVQKPAFITHVKRLMTEHSFFYAWRQGKCESPIETLVCEAMYARGEWGADQWKRLDPQHCACGFRIDLAIPEYRLAFEFDGFTYHSDKTSFNRDRERDRRLTEQGWTVIRFHGDEIRSDANAVAKQIYQRMVACQSMEWQI